MNALLPQFLVDVLAEHFVDNFVRVFDVLGAEFLIFFVQFIALVGFERCVDVEVTADKLVYGL